MMMINADLPFAFCAECGVRELEVKDLYAGGLVAETFIACAHARNCKSAVKLYQKYLDDGRQIYEKE